MKFKEKDIQSLKTQIGWKNDEVTEDVVPYLILRQNVDMFSIAQLKFCSEKTFNLISEKKHRLTNAELIEMFENQFLDAAQFGIQSPASIKRAHADSKVKRNTRTKKTA